MYCIIFVGVVNLSEITYKIYKNKSRLKIYCINIYNGYR